MQILLTNDDGIFAPGLTALEHRLSQLGDVCVVAPATEQSGVGHSITFLAPIICKEVYDHQRRRGWAVEGSPADCVKIGVFEFFETCPDIVVSGINGGLNAGINVLYSGTVAAAIEGAFFGINSVAVSLEYDERADFDAAADIAAEVIQQILAQKNSEPQLYNLNIPTVATKQPTQLRVVPMGLERYGEEFIRREDPKGRPYYWATGDPPPSSAGKETDVSALKAGFVTLTPLKYDLTSHPTLQEMNQWKWNLPARQQSS